jgi:hypothetical protein
MAKLPNEMMLFASFNQNAKAHFVGLSEGEHDESEAAQAWMTSFPGSNPLCHIHLKHDTTWQKKAGNYFDLI